MGRRSTRQRARDVWQPSIMRRGTYEASRGRTLVQDALERAHELLATHEVQPLPDDVERHIDQVVSDYRRLTVDKA
jgi:trimethylamine:corrinoid methyltransferase-like protein